MLFLAVLLITMAHFLRMRRWELFIETYEAPDRRNLMRSLSIGCAANYFLPFKMGDILRAFLSGKKMKNGLGLGLASVIVDRVLDVVTVGMIAGLVFFARFENDERAAKTFIFYVVLSLSCLMVLVITYLMRSSVKKLVINFARIFNDRIEEKVLWFSWSLICDIKDIFFRISKRRLVFYTGLMWLFYMFSNICFAIYYSGVGVKSKGLLWTDVFYTLFSDNTLLAGNFNSTGGEITAGLYLLSASIIGFIASFFLRNPESKNSNYLNLLSYVDHKDRLKFFEMYFFGGTDRKYLENYLDVNRDILILSNLTSGSDAVTLLCTDGKKTFYRKYAYEKEAEKLYAQIEWIRKHEKEIRLPKIIDTRHDKQMCYYDMNYDENTIGFFQYIHCNDVETSWKVIRDCLYDLDKRLYLDSKKMSSDSDIISYIEVKVEKNLREILKSTLLREILTYDTVYINGGEYKNLGFFKKYLGVEFLKRVFSTDYCAEIHGDLTVDNIVCLKSGSNEGYYLIDPNTGNIHDTPMLDYAKLLQSLHGSYELLMRTGSVSVDKNNISYLNIRSDAYEKLYSLYDEYLNETFDHNIVRSIYWHEVVNWLRLMPYKLKKNGNRSILFFSGLVRVLNDVYDRFESENK